MQYHRLSAGRILTSSSTKEEAVQEGVKLCAYILRLSPQYCDAEERGRSCSDGGLPGFLYGRNICFEQCAIKNLNLCGSDSFNKATTNLWK